MNVITLTGCGSTGVIHPPPRPFITPPGQDPMAAYLDWSAAIEEARWGHVQTENPYL